MATTRIGRAIDEMTPHVQKMLHKSAVVPAALLVASLCVYVPHASACSCAPGHEVGFIGPETGRLPANAIGIAWYVSSWAKSHRGEPVYDDRFSLEILDEGLFRELPARVGRTEDFSTPNDGKFLIYVIAPKEDGLRPGATYRITDHLAIFRHGHDERRVVVTIDRESLPADTEFTLDVGPAKRRSISVATTGAGCSTALEASEAWIATRLPPGAQAWREQFLYRTIVDGNHWQPKSSLCSRVEPGRSWDEVGSDRIFAACDVRDDGYYHGTPILNLKRGRHAVQVEAYVPGTDIVLKTPLKYVNLDCSGSDRPGRG